MTRRILFVDDEPNILDGLRRTLRGFRGEWDMRFAAGGAEALSALAADPADVVVSDMRMPGMHGDELLAEVRLRHPQAVRIILTGECTREAMLRVASLAHRILTKPCDPGELKEAVLQASELQGLLRSPHLIAVVGRLRSVPSKPELYNRIAPALDDPNCSLAAVGQLLARDVGVSAKLMQMANSALFGSRQAVGDVTEAVQRIGAAMVKAIVLADGILTRFDPRPLRPYSLGDIWEHSQAVGALAARIARAETTDALVLSHAQSTGVLHDIGRLILSGSEPEQYADVLRRVADDRVCVVEAERQVFGVSHAEVGAYLLGLWGMPSKVVEAVAWHQTPTPTSCPAGRFGLATAVHAADVILGPDEAGEFDTEYLARLGLLDRVPVWRELAADLTAGEGVA